MSNSEHTCLPSLNFAYQRLQDESGQNIITDFILNKSAIFTSVVVFAQAVIHPRSSPRRIDYIEVLELGRGKVLAKRRHLLLPEALSMKS